MTAQTQWGSTTGERHGLTDRSNASNPITQPIKRPSEDIFTPPIRKTTAVRSRTNRLLNCSRDAARSFHNPAHSAARELGTSREIFNQRDENEQYLDQRIEARDPFRALGLPQSVELIYREVRKVTSLYDWQKECLCDHRLLRGSNMILNLPTGAGKTLVAELLMLREVAVKNKSCILILPFVAIVQEKAGSFALLEDKLRFVVEEYANTRGRLPPHKRPQRSLYLCTIEKANVLVNSLISENRMDEIGLVICDELHMLGEQKRGGILEQCLTKIMVKSTAAQMIGMSATLSDIEHVRKFLAAYVFTTEFRPIVLREHVMLSGKTSVYDEKRNKYDEPKTVKPILPASIDVDSIVPLIAEVIPKKSVLVFCPTRVNCENFTTLLSGNVPLTIRRHRQEDRAKVVKQIKESNEGIICPVMEKSLLAGIAYHHSGLTREERILIETAFKDGTICVICATSTLAAGVNLPARRVIIRSLKIGHNYIDKVRYLQMIGRAGRAGLDTEGESFICLHEGREKEEFIKMRSAPLPSYESDNMDSARLEAFILDLFALEICKNEADVQAAFQRTMFGIKNSQVCDMIGVILEKLVKRKMLEKDYTITHFGLATSRGNIDPTQAVEVHNELVRTLDAVERVFGYSLARQPKSKEERAPTQNAAAATQSATSATQTDDSLAEGIILSSHLHLLCMIVPYDVELHKVDYSLFLTEYKNLSKGERELMTAWNVDGGSIMQAYQIVKKLESGDIMQRVYIAFMLRRLWGEAETIASVAELFNVSRGWLNVLVQATCTYANQLIRFVNDVPSLWAFRQLLPDLLSRLNMSAKKEIMPLLDIDCVKRSRAQQLYEGGYKSVGAVARANVDDLAKLLFISRAQVERMIASAKMLYRDLLAEKAEELKEIMK